ncbi:uncharacterized protein K02A2.6-like [Tachysurus vachellii]|uniref:uncharacterized protein K02A2.6-like n=1 Tax=Tachysurus vachellii TaxID=175792 RepID=UPI00296A9404|nr:uncharacterized protein K02A2.6-like [Tachysurus vachellii]
MANMVGTVTPFDCQSQSWEEYCEILQHFFEANGIADAPKQRAILLSTVGIQTYSLLRSLLSPVKPGTRTFGELVDLLKEHFNPKPSEIVQRFKFNSRSRAEGESVLEYVAVLRKLALDCNYGDKLTEMLRDRLVCGICDDRIQRRLLAESELTFERALKLAQALETANNDVKDLQAQCSESSISMRLHRMSVKQDGKGRACYRCGSLHHLANECGFISEKCHRCGKQGHIMKVCRSTLSIKDPSFQGEERHKQVGARRGRRSHYVSRDEKYESDEEGIFTVYSLEEIPRVAPLTITLAVNDSNIPFEVDTGCGVTVMNGSNFSELWEEHKNPELKTCSLKLKTYTGQSLPVLGSAQVVVRHKGTVKELPVVVVPGTGPNLLGRGWIKELGMKWEAIHKIQGTENLTLPDVLRRHTEVFKEELGEWNGPPAKIYVDKEAIPRFFKARPVPYAMKAKVEVEIERLLKENIIEPVKHSEWAAPVVPVLKPDKTVRLCGDYKLTVNRVSKLEQYPIPRLDDLFATLSGGQKFTKLDMSHAYHQIALDAESKKYVTVNTHKGLFTYHVLPFGVSSSPAIFQRTMEGVLQGIPCVAVFLDDILVTGRNDGEHLQTLARVLRRLQEAGLRLKRSKCTFMEKEVMFLGHKVDGTGLHPVPEKVTAIQNAPSPKTVTELKAYLGLLNYYNKFLPNLSTVLAPVHKLLRKDSKWHWGCEQEAAFVQSKNLIQSVQVLVHYDPQKDVILSCDASSYGLGAVLSHKMPDGRERPIGFMSRTLNQAERNYSQLDKEGLAIMFGLQRFHKYLYGRKFTIVTDHKPLLSLFNELKSVPQMSSPRVQRWAVTLRAYEYNIIYRPGKDHANADALSRLPLPIESVLEQEERVLMLENADITLITAEQVRSWTQKDPVLSRVREMVHRGFLQDLIGTEFDPFTSRKDELSVQDGCVLWGARVIIPSVGRSEVLKQLHQCHPGVARMKALARSYVWWPKLDQDVERLVKTCRVCQEHRNVPAVAPLHPWNWPEKPWQRLHVDYAGPFMGKMFLVLIDAHSKWMDVYPVNSATSAVTIECLRTSFSNHGLPELVVSDNATCFVSMEFKEFLKKNGVRHVTSAPYHASSNGLVERAVQIVKGMLKKCVEGTMATKLARVLFSYRITPQTTTGLSPAELLHGRKLRCSLDFIHPDLTRKIQERQQKQKVHHDKKAHERSFGVGDPVLVRNFTYGPKWIPGHIDTMTGPLSCKVMLGDGRVVRRHVDQVLARQKLLVNLSEELMDYKYPDLDFSENSAPAVIKETDGTEAEDISSETNPLDLIGDIAQPGEITTESLTKSFSPVVRRSQRTRKLPGHLKDYDLM